jgi:uncharacterized Fe-S cluster protein YjdI
MGKVNFQTTNATHVQECLAKETTYFKARKKKALSPDNQAKRQEMKQN